MKQFYFYVCENPDCFSSFVPGFTKEPQSPQRCHACQKPRRKITLYKPHPKAVA